MLKKVLTLLALLATSSFYLFSQEIKITINGDVYSREMPEDYESAKDFILEFVELYNDADKEIVMMRIARDEETAKYLDKIDKLEQQLDKTVKDLEDAKKKAEKNQDIIKNENSICNRALMSFLVGPVVDKENVVGTHLQLGGDFRLIKNLHIVGSVFGDIFNSSNILSFNVGLGIGLGFGIY